MAKAKKGLCHVGAFGKFSPRRHRCVAQLGSALRSGRRGRRFESSHTDHIGKGRSSSGLFAFGMPRAMRHLPCISSSLSFLVWSIIPHAKACFPGRSRASGSLPLEPGTLLLHRLCQHQTFIDGSPSNGNPPVVAPRLAVHMARRTDGLLDTMSSLHTVATTQIGLEAGVAAGRWHVRYRHHEYQSRYSISHAHFVQLSKACDQSRRVARCRVFHGCDMPDGKPP